MFAECDLVNQGYYLGNGWVKIPKEVRQRAEETARDRWMLLFQPLCFFHYLIVLVKVVFIAGQMVSERRCIQRGAYRKTVPIRPLDLPVEVVHPLSIAGIPVPK